MPRIDTHHHLVAPKYLVPLQEAGILLKHDADAMNVGMALEDMDKGGVTVAVNSTPAPPRFAPSKSHAVGLNCMSSRSKTSELTGCLLDRYPA